MTQYGVGGGMITEGEEEEEKAVVTARSEFVFPPPIQPERRPHPLDDAAPMTAGLAEINPLYVVRIEELERGMKFWQQQPLPSKTETEEALSRVEEWRRREREMVNKTE